MIWIDRLRTDNSLRKIIHSDNTEELVHIEEEPTNVLRVGTLLGNENLNTFEKNIGTYGEDTYDNEATYEVGDIITYQGLLYKCIVQIDEAEEFNSSHWQNINLVQEKASIDDIQILLGIINTNLERLIQLEEKVAINYITDQEIATNEYLDNKRIYFRRYYWNSLGDNTRTAKPLGITLNNIEIFKIEGYAYSNSGNVFTLSNESLEVQSASALKLTIYSSDNTIGVETCNSNFIRGKAYANLYYTKKNETN